MGLRLIVLCLFVALCRDYSHATDTNLPADADARDIFIATEGKIRTGLIAAGEWSKPVSDGQGTKISGRLIVYDGVCFTNEFGKPSWFAAPVFVEITNEMRYPIKIFFNWENDVHFELRDVHGKSADHLKGHGGFVGSPNRSPEWVTVPANGIVRLRENRNVSLQIAGTNHSNPDSLELFFGLGKDWFIPGSDANAYFLSATFSPRPTKSSPGSNAVWQARLEFPAVKVSTTKQ